MDSPLRGDGDELPPAKPLLRGKQHPQRGGIECVDPAQVKGDFGMVDRVVVLDQLPNRVDVVEIDLTAQRDDEPLARAEGLQNRRSPQRFELASRPALA